MTTPLSQALFGGALVNAGSSQFGTWDGTGTTDMLPNLQAAEAYRVAQGKEGLLIPDGSYIKLSDTFVPTNATSFALIGEGISGNLTGYGIGIRATFNDKPVIALPDSMRKVFIGGFHITTEVTADHPLLRNKAGAGIAIHSGASDTTIENVWINRFYNGIMTSYDFADANAEKNVFRNIETSEVAIGVHIAKLQNRGVAIYDSRLNAVTNVYTRSTPLVVDNYHGAPSDPSYAVLTVASVSGHVITPSGDPNYYCHFYEFVWTHPYIEVTMTVAGSPSAFELAMLAVAGGGSDMPYIQPGGYQALGLVTSRYGTVPMTPISFDSGTGVLVARVWPYWYYLGFNDPSDLLSDLTSSTTLYASTWGSFFIGNGMTIKGGHAEPPHNVVTVIGNTNVGSSGYTTRLQDFTTGDDITENTASVAVYELQKVFPYFLQHNGDGEFVLDGVRTGDTYISRLNFDQIGTVTSRTFVRNCPSFRYKFNERLLDAPNINGAPENWENVNSKAFGAIHSDRPNGPVTSLNSRFIVGSGWMQSAYVGSRPDLPAIPQMSPALIANVVTPTAIGAFPLPFGERFYQVVNWNVTGSTATNAFAKWAHIGITYFLDFDGGSNWNRIGFSAVGGSPFVVLNDDNSGADILKVAQPGWVLVLNNGTTDDLYICTGFDPDYFVLTIRNLDGTDKGFNGTVGSTYTGNVKQQASTLEYFGAKV